MKGPWILLVASCVSLMMGSATQADAPGQQLTEVVRLSEPVAADDHSETFGQPIDASLPQLSLAELVDGAEQHLGKPIRVETRIARVCQKKGCFFMAAEGDLTLRVSFKDYGFFIPTDASGKQVMLTGTLVSKQVSAEQASHFSADLGDSAGAATGVTTGQVYEIVADAVRIPR